MTSIFFYQIEGTLVTDGMNVYYIMKPNENVENCKSEELIVNIPIKGSHLLKPSGSSKAKSRCASCGSRGTGGK